MVQMSLCLCTICFKQNTSQVLPLRQNQDILDSDGCHGEDVWSTGEKTERKLNSGETAGGRNTNGA